MGKTCWMIVTRRENFEISRERGFDVQGFESIQRRKASRVAVDDRLIYYLSDERVFVATATVKSEPFDDDEPIWLHHRTDEFYPHRVEIEVDSVLETPHCIDALGVGPRLEYVRKWPPEDWPLAFVGSLHIIPQRDFNYLEEEIQRAAKKGARRRKNTRRKRNGSQDAGERGSTLAPSGSTAG